VSRTPVPLDALLAVLRQRLPALQGVWLFGSEAKGTAHAGSDIDIAVLGPAPFDAVQLFDVGLDLGVLAGRDVDLVDLRRLPVVVQKEVLVEGRRIDGIDGAACEAFESLAIAMYVAFRDELAQAAASDMTR
jgi:predicted nucleotidyltransferase